MGSLKRLGPSCCAVLLGLFSGACQRDLEGDAGLDSGLDAGCGAVGFTYAQNVIVDAVAGVDDTKCACGSPAHPCKSLTYCMQLIAEGAVQNVTLHAQMSDGGPEWPVDLEPWPVHLGWGVTLEAPELYFNGPPIDGGPPLLYVYSYDAGDQSAVTIEGDPTEAGRYIHLGIPVADIGVTSTFTAITDPAPDPGTVHYFGGLPLVLQNAWLQGGEAALAVNDGASVQLGPLPVHFGTNGWQKNLENTQTAISCNGSYGAPPQIFDTGIAPVQIDDANLAISTGGSTCNISLTHGPRIGSQPQAIFDGGCSPFEQWAIGLTFGVHVTLGSLSQPAILSCQQDTAVFLVGAEGEDLINVPRFDFTGTFENQRCFGVFANTGEVILTSSEFQNSLGGIWLDGDATLSLDVPYGDTPLNNLDICYQPPQGGCGFDNLYNSPDGALVAVESPDVSLDLRYVAWKHWDPVRRQPQFWKCTDPDYFSGCACFGPDCPDGGNGVLQHGADVVFHYEPKELPDFDGGQAGTCP